MKKQLAVFNTDQINRYGYRFTIEALESCLSQAWGGTPMFLSHDYHRPIGISRPLALHLHSSQVSLMGICMLAESEKETEAVVNFARHYLLQRFTEVDEADDQRLRARLAEHLSESAIVIARECTSVIDQGIAKRVFPSLFSGDETDKRSLVPVRDLKQIGPGVFEIDGFAIFAHRYFRRSHSQINNLNGIFLEKLYQLREAEGLDVKVALDADSIGLPSTYRCPLELEWWQGPKFDDNLANIRAGVTRYKASERERMFYGIDITDFWWHRQNGLQSLECEELRDNPTVSSSDDTYGCRYVHSIIDKRTELPNHLDGAIREYNGEAFMERIGVDISKAGKNSRYVKLWRIDGQIDLVKWKELICDFYRDNRQLGEYLGASEVADRNVKDSVLDAASSVARSSLAPLFLSDNDSAQIAVSYHDVSNFEPMSDCSVLSYENLVIGEKRLNVIEFSAIDLVKSVGQRISGVLALPDEASYVAFEDLDINFPLFLFKGETARENATQALLCFIALCRRFGAGEARRFVTASIGLRYDDVVVIFSFAGFASSLLDIFDSGLDNLPLGFDDVGRWCTKCQTLQKKVAAESPMVSDVLDLLKPSGCFSFTRSFRITETLVSIDKYGSALVRVPEEEKEVAHALNVGALKIAPVYFISGCQCKKCGGSYFDCKCSVLMEDECTVSVTEHEPLGFFLTERRAW